MIPAMPERKRLIPAAGIFHYENQVQTMQTILKVMSCLIGLFVIVSGLWIVAMPPFSDEPQGYAIIAVGLAIPLITLYVAGMDDRAEA